MRVESPFLQRTLFILSHGIMWCVLKVHFLKGPYIVFILSHRVMRFVLKVHFLKGPYLYYPKYMIKFKKK